MLRIIFLGMEIRILDELRRCPVEILGAYLPPAPYRIRRIARFFPLAHWIKCLRTAGLYGRLSEYLKLHNIAPIKSNHINDPGSVLKIGELKPDLGIVANFGQILSPSVLCIPRCGFINYHPSLLPRYAGPHPFEAILADRVQVSGITWHQMTPEVDGGDILVQECFQVHPEDRIEDLDYKSIQAAKKKLGPLLAGIAKRPLSLRQQNTAAFDSSIYQGTIEQAKAR